jgi:hypothetical protein
MSRLYYKSYETLGNALTPKMERADSYRGAGVLEFAPRIACVLGVVAPAPVRCALSNIRRVC